jgi:hypothetical protein
MKKADKSSSTSSSTGPAPPRKFRPVSPLLDEAAILAQLAVKLDPKHTNQPTRSAALMAIVDAYDRQLPRGPFLQVVGRAVNMNEQIRQVEILMSMRMELLANEHSIEEIVKRIDKTLELKYQAAEEFRMGLYRDISYIEQMAWDDTPIN